MSGILAIALNPAVDLSADAATIEHTRKVRTSGERYDPGGGGINVARVVTLLGGDAEAVFTEGGEMGALLVRLVRERGVRCRTVPIAGQTRVNFSVHEQKTGREYRFVLQGPQISAAELEPLVEIVAAHEAAYVVASGSLPVGCPTDIYKRMAEAAAARGARFVLDSSREGLRATLGSAPVHLVKPSIGELEQYVGEKLDEEGVRRAAGALVDRGDADMVAVTLGAQGALLASREGILRLSAIHVPEYSAVGAGDSFLGAMVFALSRGHSPVDAFRLGVAAGAAAVMTAGTELCHRDDVLRLYRHMCLRDGAVPVE